MRRPDPPPLAPAGPLLLGGLFVVLLSLVAGSGGGGAHALTGKWTVGIPGGLDKADRVAAEHECANLGLVRGFTDVYLFEKRLVEGDGERVHRTRRALERHPLVLWVDPQTPHERVKRDALNKDQLLAMHHAALATNKMLASGPRSAPAPFERGVYAAPGIMSAPNQQKPAPAPPSLAGDGASGASKSIPAGPNASPNPSARPFNDELWTHQWYLQDNANVAQLQSDIELKVEDVWRMGYTGAGVVVTILDDGLEWNHTDILPNYDPKASWDMNNNRSDPFPRYDSYDTNSHGTRCAGEVSMMANNRKCGVGIAHRAKIGGIKCLDGEVADHIESMSLLHNLDHVDIYSGSWGPSDNGKVVDGPKRLTAQALEWGTRHGRQGRGALYVWANGNGGAVGDNCNCDGYVASIYTISVGGVSQQGQIPFYGERCSSTLAVTCSSGAYTDRKIVTTDLHNKCTIDYTGTSAAAPLAAGVYALVLEANRNLTWRDVQHLTVWTSDPLPIRDNPGWKRNAAGLYFNSRFGFGLMNAKAMVEAALAWKSAPRKSACIVRPITQLPVYLSSRNMAQVVFESDGCQREYELHHAASAGGHSRGRPHAGQLHQAQHKPHAQHAHARAPEPAPAPDGPSPVIFLEHVQLIVDIEYTSRGSLDIFLVSPSRTISTLLSRRPLDNSRNGFDKWPLMSVHFWAETSVGTWTVIVRDKDSQNNRGLLRNATLVLHGTTARPAHMAQARVYEGEAQVQSFIDPVLDFDEDDIYDLNSFPNEMVLARDDSYTPTLIKSIIASELSNNLRS